MDKGTIDYYNRNADRYYWTTVGVDMDAFRKKFASYLPNEASVIDMGCGSGRDVMAFSDMGHAAVGLDGAKELLKLAEERLGIKTVAADMSGYRAASPYDGIWCCASVIHLNEEEKESFFRNLDYNLKPGGVLFISVKEGAETGRDSSGVYTGSCTRAELKKRLEDAGCEILDEKVTADAMGRSGVRWINVFARKKED